MGILLAATLWALVRKPMWGFLGAWFFLILAPTSSFMPIRDLAFEQRMYLPLAAVIALAVVAAHLLVGSAGGPLWAFGAGRRCVRIAAAIALMLPLTLALGWRTYVRNLDYRDAISIWAAATKVSPQNPRAWSNLGLMCFYAARYAGGEDDCAEAIRLNPDFADAAQQSRARLRRMNPSTRRCATTTRRSGSTRVLADAYINRANAYDALGRSQDALRDYGRAIEVNPDDRLAYVNRAITYYRLKEYAKALADLEKSRTSAALRPSSSSRTSNGPWGGRGSGVFIVSCSSSSSASSNFRSERPTPRTSAFRPPLRRRPQAGGKLSRCARGPSARRAATERRGFLHQEKGEAMNRSIAVVGLGYVGLPLAVAFGKKAPVIGFDISREADRGIAPARGPHARGLGRGPRRGAGGVHAPIRRRSSARTSSSSPSPRPWTTPSSRTSPAWSAPASSSARNCAAARSSSSSPPSIRASRRTSACRRSNAPPGWSAGRDFKVGYSPERINPGDHEHTLARVVKVVSGMDAETLEIVAQVYGLVAEPGRLQGGEHQDRRGGQGDREHPARPEHRADERTGDDLPPDGPRHLAGARSGRDEVEFPPLQARAGRRALHRRGPVLPHAEGGAAGLPSAGDPGRPADQRQHGQVRRRADRSSCW